MLSLCRLPWIACATTRYAPFSWRWGWGGARPKTKKPRGSPPLPRPGWTRPNSPICWIGSRRRPRPPSGGCSRGASSPPLSFWPSMALCACRPIRLPAPPRPKPKGHPPPPKTNGRPSWRGRSVPRPCRPGGNPKASAKSFSMAGCCSRGRISRCRTRPGLPYPGRCANRWNGCWPHAWAYSRCPASLLIHCQRSRPCCSTTWPNGSSIVSNNATWFCYRAAGCRRAICAPSRNDFCTRRRTTRRPRRPLHINRPIGPPF